MSEDTRKPSPARLGRTAIGFIVFMALLTALFATLGFWQLDRLQWKTGLLDAIEERAENPPVPLPSVREWDAFDAEALDYTPVVFTARYLDQPPVLVFDSLADPRGALGGPGYWVMQTAAVDGGVVWINRGFITQAMADAGEIPVAPAGSITLDGLLRRPERAGAFTPEADLTSGKAWVRDPATLPSPELGQGPLAPFYVDLSATAEPGDVPQGGETHLAITNNHLDYALTWFGLAVLTPVMVIIWLWRRRRSTSTVAPPKP